MFFMKGKSSPEPILLFLLLGEATYEIKLFCVRRYLILLRILEKKY